MKSTSVSAFNDFGAHNCALFERKESSASRTDFPGDVITSFLASQSATRLVAFVESPAFAFPSATVIRAKVRCDADARYALLQGWSGFSDRLISELATSDTAFLVSSCFLAAVADPRPLLLALKRLCLSGPTKVLFLYQESASGLRHWSRAEFRAFLALAGFDVTDAVASRRGNAFVGAMDPDAYRSVLQSFGWSPTLLDADLLVITTEDAAVKSSGGIGTYVKNLRNLYSRAAFLLCDLEMTEISAEMRTLLPRMFFELPWRDNFFDGLGLIENLKCVLYMLPHIEVVEFQDYQSVGFRLVQAKKTGVLPSSLIFRVFNHGGIDYIKHGVQDIFSMDYTPHEASLAIRDSYVLKNADQCFSPSRYLGEHLLKNEFGYELNNPSIVRLPFDMALVDDSTPIDFGPVRRIVFIGKYMKLKGWPDFLEAMELLHREGKLAQIDEIVSLGPLAPPPEELRRLSAICKYRFIHLSHGELIKFVRNHAHDSLFVVPSQSESFSYVVLEQLLLGTLLVAYNRGGAVEVVDDPEYVGDFFSDPGSRQLAGKIAGILALPPEKYRARLHEFRGRAQQKQRDVNAWWAEGHHGTSSWLPKFDWANERPDISVVIPVYNTDLTFLAELLESVRDGILRPNAVILVNDGSDPAYSEPLRRCAETALKEIPFHIHEQRNQGLPAARNAGLKFSKSDLTFVIDSDDLLLPNGLLDAWVALSVDSSLLVATGFAVNFTETRSVPKGGRSLLEGAFWKPLGIPEARALSLLENQYMGASAMVRTRELVAAGGWDESDRSTWEDWALYTSLAWSGHRFSLIPQATWLYRNTPGSMSKTYNRYFGRRRLVRNVPGMSRLDANILMSLVNSGASVGGARLNGPSLSDKEVELINIIRKMLMRPKMKRLLYFIYDSYVRLRRFSKI